MRTLIYKYKTGERDLTLSLFHTDGKLFWQHQYPSFTDNADDGELVEDKTLIEFGVMKSLNDTEGLKDHLMKSGVLHYEDTIVAAKN